MGDGVLDEAVEEDCAVAVDAQSARAHAKVNDTNSRLEARVNGIVSSKLTGALVMVLCIFFYSSTARTM